MTRPSPAPRSGGFDGIDLLIVTGIGVLAAVTALQWLIGNAAALLDGQPETPSGSNTRTSPVC